jgi:hypothetical protein
MLMLKKMLDKVGGSTSSTQDVDARPQAQHGKKEINHNTHARGYQEN